MRRSLFIIIGKIMAEEGAPRLTLECFRGIIIRICFGIWRDIYDGFSGPAFGTGP